VRNPWDLTHSAGGSSGGAGLRSLPASFQWRTRATAAALFVSSLMRWSRWSQKPSRDRIPSGPDYGDLLCGLACEFAVTRSVRDAAALLDAVAGADVGAPGLLARQLVRIVKKPPFNRVVSAIAWTTTTASGAKIDPECEKAVLETVRLLESLGHTTH